MPSRIFKVDLSDGARDYAPTATEPGLAMLDRQMANYGILRRWLGDFAAEPEFQGDFVSFFIREEERGRLENIECYPATKTDLEGPLKPDLDALSARIKKIKPDSRTEQLVHKILKQTFTQLTNNLETSDHDSFFFQYRERGQPWKLVWCWGYQRADMQPAPALICSNPQCNQLYVRRPNGDDECPGCTTRGGKRKGAWPFGLTVERLAMMGLALALLLALFFFLNQPRLIVEPNEWHGPVGSVASFKVVETKYFFFRNDVTRSSRPVSDDPRVLSIKNGKATAKSIGSTNVAFSYQNLTTVMPVYVDPPSPPDSIRLEPDKIRLGIGSVAHVKVIGHYDEGNRDVELSPDQAEWEITDDKIVFGKEGFFEGASEGKTTIQAKVLKSVFDQTYAEATLEVDVADVKYETLVLGVSPDQIPLRDTAIVTAMCADKEGNPYDFMGSTRLKLSVEPSSVASLTLDVLTGIAPGAGEVKGKIDDDLGGLAQTAKFQVGDTQVATVFSVSPKSIRIMEDEYFNLTVIGGGSETIMSKSSDDIIVQAVGPTAIVGRFPGKAIITVSQGDKMAQVEVEVVANEFQSLAIEPNYMKLRIGEVGSVRVVATTRDGGRRVDVDPARLIWVRQPPADIAYFDREKMTLSAQRLSEPTPLICRLGTLEANASIEVAESLVGRVKNPLDIDGEFGAHPPINIGRSTIPGGIATTVLGPNGFRLDGGKLYIGEGDAVTRLRLPQGEIVSINGRPLRDIPLADIRRYVEGLGPDALVEIRNAEGNIIKTRLGESVTGIQEVKVAIVRPVNLTADSFNAEVLFDLRQAADCRITDDKNVPLSDWKPVAAGPGSITTTAKIPRVESLEHDYKLFIELKRADKVRPYEFQFKLESESPKPPIAPVPAPVPAAPAGGGAAKSDLEALRKAGVAP